MIAAHGEADQDGREHEEERAGHEDEPDTEMRHDGASGDRSESESEASHGGRPAEHLAAGAFVGLFREPDLHGGVDAAAHERGGESQDEKRHDPPHERNGKHEDGGQDGGNDGEAAGRVMVGEVSEQEPGHDAGESAEAGQRTGDPGCAFDAAVQLLDEKRDEGIVERTGEHDQPHDEQDREEKGDLGGFGAERLAFLLYGHGRTRDP